MSTHSKLLGSVSLLATALATLQGATAQDQTMETVTVTGIRAAIVQGLELKRESNVIVESIAAEDIGKMPDSNLAEALQRVPGVSIDRDGGEGRYVTIRGLGPDFNTLLLNGRRVATTEYTRSFAFDTISSDMVGGMNVYKTHAAPHGSHGVPRRWPDRIQSLGQQRQDLAARLGPVFGHFPE
jgi:outer membrane receptor for ferrienterochelin and colicin